MLGGRNQLRHLLMHYCVPINSKQLIFFLRMRAHQPRGAKGSFF